MKAEAERYDRPWTRLIIGAALLTAGSIVWLDQLGRIEAHDYLRWWSIVLIAIGLGNATDRRWTPAIVFIVLGLVFLPVAHVRVWWFFAMWPLLISFAGVTLIAQAWRPAVPTRGTPGSFRAVAVMAGSGRTLGASEFVGGEAIAVMGGCEIDLRSAHLTKEATIDVLAFWGGIEIRVPAGWRVRYRNAMIFGAVSDKTVPPPANVDAPVLVIRGSAIMAGVEVKH